MDFVMVLLTNYLTSVFDYLYVNVCLYVIIITQIKMNGPEAAAVMRKDLLYTGPIIGTVMPNIENKTRVSDHYHYDAAGVTGNALPEDIALFISKGASEVLTKPLTKSKLLGALSRHMHLEEF